MPFLPQLLIYRCVAARTFADRCPLLCLSLKYLHSWGSELWRRINQLMINGMCAATFWNTSGICKHFFAPPITSQLSVIYIDLCQTYSLMKPRYYFIFWSRLILKVCCLAILLLSNCLYLPKYLKYGTYSLLSYNFVAELVCTVHYDRISWGYLSYMYVSTTVSCTCATVA